MREIASVFEARNWLLNTFGGSVIEEYIDEWNENYKGKTVGFIYVKNRTPFFMRFRRNVMSFNNHYPQFEQGGIGFGFNRSEIEQQINGLYLKTQKGIVKNVWCMVIRPDQKIYVANPSEVKEFVRRFNTVKSYFRKQDVPDEDEDVLNVPFRLFINFNDWLKGKVKSDFDWEQIRCLGRETKKEARGMTLNGFMGGNKNGA